MGSTVNAYLLYDRSTSIRKGAITSAIYIIALAEVFRPGDVSVRRAHTAAVLLDSTMQIVAMNETFISAWSARHVEPGCISPCRASWVHI